MYVYKFLMTIACAGLAPSSGQQGAVFNFAFDGTMQQQQQNPVTKQHGRKLLTADRSHKAGKVRRESVSGQASLLASASTEVAS